MTTEVGLPIHLKHAFHTFPYTFHNCNVTMFDLGPLEHDVALHVMILVITSNLRSVMVYIACGSRVFQFNHFYFSHHSTRVLSKHQTPFCYYFDIVVFL